MSCNSVGCKGSGISEPTFADLAGTTAPQLSPIIAPLSKRAANTEGGISAAMSSFVLTDGTPTNLDGESMGRGSAVSTSIRPEIDVDATSTFKHLRFELFGAESLVR